MLTGKKANNGYNVTFSHIRNKKLQGANLQDKKVYWPEMQRWVTLKVSTKASVAPLQPPAANGQRIPRWPSMQHPLVVQAELVSGSGAFSRGPACRGIVLRAP